MPDEPTATIEEVENPYGEGQVLKVTAPGGAWHIHDPADNLTYCNVCRNLGVHDE